ncbi:MAG TPA: hypothetical protein VJH91_03635 [Candidatus Paceibacterota bacterium]
MQMATLFAALAGLCSGTWPFFMRQTGLGAHFMPLAFSASTLLVTGAFAFLWSQQYGMGSVSVRWEMLIPAGLFGAGVLVGVGLMLMYSAPERVGVNLLVLALVQITVPAVYTLYVHGQIPSARLVAGFAAAYFAVWALVGANVGPKPSVAVAESAAIQKSAQ